MSPGDPALPAAKAVAAAYGHKIGRWDTYGVCECVRCEAALVNSDAIAFVRDRSFAALGSLGLQCPG